MPSTSAVSENVALMTLNPDFKVLCTILFTTAKLLVMFQFGSEMYLSPRLSYRVDENKPLYRLY